MTDTNRDLMGLKRTDSMLSVTVSGVLIIGAIAGLVIWALQTAYNFS